MIGFVINMIAVMFNLWVGATFGFTPLTYFCIMLNVAVGFFCLTMDALN